MYPMACPHTFIIWSWRNFSLRGSMSSLEYINDAICFYYQLKCHMNDSVLAWQGNPDCSWKRWRLNSSGRPVTSDLWLGAFRLNQQSSKIKAARLDFLACRVCSVASTVQPYYHWPLITGRRAFLHTFARSSVVLLFPSDWSRYRKPDRRRDSQCRHPGSASRATEKRLHLWKQLKEKKKSFDDSEWHREATFIWTYRNRIKRTAHTSSRASLGDRGKLVML